MQLHALARRVDRLEGFGDLLAALRARRTHAQVDGLVGPTRALALARLFASAPRPTLLITYQNEQCQRLWDDLRAFGMPEESLRILPHSEGRWLSHEATDYRMLGERVAALVALAQGRPSIVIGTFEAVLQRCGPPNELVADPLQIYTGMTADLESLLHALVQRGYESDHTVTRPGQFSRRGGILDVYPITAANPIRMELFGDEVERLRTFDVATQRSISHVSEAELYPVRDVLLTRERVDLAVPRIREALQSRKMALARARNREAFYTLDEQVSKDLELLENQVYGPVVEEYLHYLVPETYSALDYLYHGAEESLVVLDEPYQAEEHYKRIRRDIGASRERRFERGELLEGAAHPSYDDSALERAAERGSMLILSQLPRTYENLPRPSLRIKATTSAIESYRSRLPFFAEEVRSWLSHGACCVVVSSQPQRVRQICAEQGLTVQETTEVEPESGLAVVDGSLRQGFKFDDIRLYVITDAELFAAARPVVTRKRAAAGIPVSSLLDLREGDYVVHVQHGIGRYAGIAKRTVDGAERDFVVVQYAGNDRLYVPADQIDRVQRYIGSDAGPPVINRIGGTEWQRTTRRAREQARIMARELIELYAARQAAERASYGMDSPWQLEMEEAFPYEETPSQLRAIHEVKRDLEDVRPMDRLICGDVGFGKTEVAIRAAFKVVEAGKQVAVLCPTTVLAAQHHTTFSERLAAYPIRVDLLSRFRDRKQQKETLEALKSGLVQVVIGTHRLLSKDVEFDSLGLLIVDEEQRFGVAQKERLKQLRKTVDVLSLSATPIPRTLSMALSGLRDMSIIEDPPAGRMPIVTKVTAFEPELVRDAILRELERDGQVYFVHNRIETIANVAQRVQRLVPDARIRIGHGQMSEDELERIMYDFYHREFDVLVCTTIIENGLDVANANTLIINRADRMGLAQLYQLRGRVGRSDRQAYAYLFYEGERKLTEDAERRLLAIREFTELGSGFQVAMRDLEIRGAGNLLGAEQHGIMVTVGFDLYCQLLAEAVSELKGEEALEAPLPPVDVPVTAHIPPEYVPSEAERIYCYKRMANVRSAADVAVLNEELIDRYGTPPQSVWNALAVLQLRLRARQAGIESIRGERREVHFRFGAGRRLSPQALRVLTHAYRDQRFTPDSAVMRLRTPEVLREVEEMIEFLDRALSADGEVGARK
jgi:transcription-repair coupling factor (superfamily II helicase)